MTASIFKNNIFIMEMSSPQEDWLQQTEDSF